MVVRLAEAGHDVQALDRSAEKHCVIEELGATAVAEVSEVGSQAAVVVVCVFTDEQVRQVCLDSDPLATMQNGSALVVHTTASPRTVCLRPVLGCYGDPVLHVGPTGAGQKVKLVNNALFAAQIELLAESIRLGTWLGVPESTLLAALPQGSAASRVLSIIAARGSVTSFTETAREFVGKDVAVVRAIAAELGGDLGVLENVIDAAVKV
ncbi:MAG TPA: NAD-binding protein [Mycobacterium sp.]|nr:NAD-binding protein [Mycobacterium sp.]